MVSLFTSKEAMFTPLCQPKSFLGYLKYQENVKIFPMLAYKPRSVKIQCFNFYVRFEDIAQSGAFNLPVEHQYQ